MAQWFQEAFHKFGEMTLPQAIIITTLLVAGIGLFVVGGKKVKWTTRMLTYASLSIALSFILSMIRLYKMPQGGSVTAAGMLPLILFSYTFGTIPGICAGAVYGLLDFLQGGYFLNVWSFLLDYPIAYALVGLAGLAGKMKNEKAGIATASIIACIGRFLASLMSGVMFYASYAQGTGMSPLVYSIVYNGSYMLPEMVICVIISLLVGRRVVQSIKHV